jgi:hypothetical protein
MRRLTPAAPVLAAVLLAGCNLPFLSAPAPTTSPTPMRVLTAPTPNPVAASQAPQLTTGRSVPLPTVVASQLEYVQWLLANPGTGQPLLPSVAVPGCSGYDQVDGQLSGLLGAGAMLSPTAPFIIAVAGGPTSTTTGLADGSTRVDSGPEVTLTVRATRGAEQVLNPTGQVVNRIPQLPPTAFSYGLLLGPDGNWRFCEVRPAETGGSRSGNATIW